MPDHLYPPVGKCIYCGTTKVPPGKTALGDEHIIPLGFGGNLVLQEASCDVCAGIINRQIETPVLSHEWGDLRARLDFPTRKKKLRRIRKAGSVRATAIDGSPMRIPLADHSTPTVMYKFSEARLLNGLGPGADDLRWTVTMIMDHAEEIAMQAKYPNWNKHHRFKARPYEFARLLAKIAYGYVVAEYGFGFKPIVLDIILGRTTDYFLAVGGSWDIQAAVPGGDHITNITMRMMSPGRILIVVEIRLFSQVAAPSYHVAVGEIDLKNPEHVACIEKHRLEGKIVITPLQIG